jgi:hypothetical protein
MLATLSETSTHNLQHRSWSAHKKCVRQCATVLRMKVLQLPPAATEPTCMNVSLAGPRTLQSCAHQRGNPQGLASTACRYSTAKAQTCALNKPQCKAIHKAFSAITSASGTRNRPPLAAGGRQKTCSTRHGKCLSNGTQETTGAIAGCLACICQCGLLAFVANAQHAASCVLSSCKHWLPGSTTNSMSQVFAL